MKKAIVLIIALVALPLNLALAAPAGSGQSDLRAQLEQAQSQKAEQLCAISLEASLMKDVMNQSTYAPMPVVSLETMNTSDADI